MSFSSLSLKKASNLSLLIFFLLLNLNVYSVPKEFIIDGDQIDISQRPFTALIVNTDLTFLASCSAVIIDNQWILTAGHCVDENTRIEDILVKVDVNDSSAEDQVLEVEDIIIHPGFRTDQFTILGNDIALLKLKNPITFNDRVQKINLASASDMDLVKPGIIGNLSGWGDTSTDPDARANFKLNTVDLPIVSLNDANNINAFNGRLVPNMLPAGSRSNNKGSCKGDSGGPFVVPDGKGGVLLAGISSFGQCDKDINGPFSVFTRISSHNNWIESVIEEKVFAWFEPTSDNIFDFDFIDLENLTEPLNDNLTETSYSWEVKNSSNEIIFSSKLSDIRLNPLARGTYTISLTASNSTGTSTHSEKITVLGKCATFPKVNSEQLSVLKQGNKKISNFKENKILNMSYSIPTDFNQVISKVTVFFDTPLKLDERSQLTLGLNVTNGNQEGFAKISLPEVKNQIDKDGKYTFELDRRITINDDADIFELFIEANGRRSGDDVSVLTVKNPQSDAILNTLQDFEGDSKEFVGYELAVEYGVCRSVNPSFNRLPWVGLSNPNDYSTFKIGDKINLVAIAEDPENDIERVNFRVNGAQIKSDITAPYEQIFEPDAVGQYEIEVVVVDGGGKRNKSSITIIVNDKENEAPQITITSPTNNAEFSLGEEITLAADASDPNGNLDKVNFKINDNFFKTDNSIPFSNTFTPTEAGTYIIGARAFDDEGLSTEVTVTINVKAPNREPSVSITSPADGAVFALGETIVLSADASDPDGNLEKVNFKINGNFYKTDSTSPFTNSFTPTDPGIYVIGARAFDKDGLSKEETITIEVASPVLSNEVFVDLDLPKEIKIYPSPASNIISISGLLEEKSEARIIDITGKIIKSSRVDRSNNSIGVSELPNGVYFLNLYINNKAQTTAFLKK